MKELFGPPYDDSDPYWIMKSYFDRMYADGRFLEAVSYLAKKWGFSTDGAYCNFPDKNSFFDDDHFEGVEFSYGYPPSVENKITVSDEVFCKYFILACEEYVKHRPEDADQVAKILQGYYF